MSRTHCKTLFLLQTMPSALAASLASQRIFRYALSPELLASATETCFSKTKRLLQWVRKVKIVTFVPIENAEAVREALGRAGAGQIGEYSFCSFSVKGDGRFAPSEKSNPHIGQANKLEVVEEDRIKVNCDRQYALAVIDAMKKVHPYEEVAFDIYPLLAEDEL